MISDANKKTEFLIISLFLLIIGMIIAVTRGAYNIPIIDVFYTIIYKAGIEIIPEFNNELVVWQIRLPRIFLSVVVGIALATAGTVYQGVFRNPLVEPYLLGVSSAAAFGAAISIVLHLSFLSLQLTSFAFGMIAMILAYTLATVKKETPLINLILAGIVVSAIFSAGLSYLKMTAGYRELRDLVFWLMGGLYTAKWGDVVLLFMLVGISFFVLWSLSWKLNVLTMGDEEAQSLGISVKKIKALCILLATFITSIAIGTVGIIAWVGLIIPHMARMTIGPDHRYLIPASAIIGSLFLLICDTLARTLTSGEIPISVLTSVIAAPYLIFLVRKNRNLYFG
ncbi:MAG: Cobalamin import system permease protein BtuC [Candidatus Methanofastidiosum methylothiophilum]|uniref:Cobalamin import system permease protein BtuC n=1 Tax=Candidatus Methanofastidiosum methylothiophilum TaxID=1705564 RepID=A0A150IVG8_9EURY|nr:MAG: Cobalamin import system permease protein BtuC [Candidatus Methanofastidiosum methylthiophilus]